MNVENMRILRAKLAEVRDVNPARFDMRCFFSTGCGYDAHDPVAADPHACGTAACIAGWAKLIFDPSSEDHAVTLAEERLDLSSDEACRLFFGEFSEAEHYGEITIDEAITEIDRMIADAGENG